MSLLRKVTDFILQSRSRAFGVAFVCAYIPLLGSISILIAGLVTLRKGALEGFYILIAATVPFLLSYFLASPPADQVQMALMGIIAVVASNIVVWVYAVLLRKYSNWSLILELSVLAGVMIIGAIHLFFPDIQNWWAAQLTTCFARATATAAGVANTDLSMQMQAVNIIKPFATGLVILSILLNGLFQLLLARWWEVIMFAVPGGLRKELYNIRFGYVVAGLFVLIMLGSYIGNAIALDMRPVFSGLFFIAGLSLIHCVLSVTKYRWLWLGLVYIGIVVLFPKSVIAIAVFALLDVLLNLRRRLTRV